MVRLLGIALILISLMGETIPARAQNPFISKESPRKISLAQGPRYPFLAKIAEWQLHLKQKMTVLTRQAKETGSLRPLISLVIIAFAYGILHAAGPGHGKAVALSYLISRGRKLGRGVLLGNMIAFFHGLSGMLLVLAAYFILQKGVSGPLEAVTRTTQLISYSLIALLGAGMLLRSILIWLRGTGIETSDPSMDFDDKKRNPLVMALAVGVVPCPGIVLVMLFCLSINVIRLGLVLALFVVLGMAMTISAVGVVGLAGKNLVIGALEGRHKLAEMIQRVIETLASFMVLALGLLFLAATI